VNKYSAEFLALLQNRYAHDKAEMSVSDWIVANTKLNGRPFSFARYPFQRAIADDMHPNMDVIKPSQVGMTEIQIRKILAWLMRNNGMTAIYTMPDDDMFKRVSQGRVQPIIQKDQVFFPRKGEKMVRSRDIVQLRDSWLYLTGASEGDATSISADMVMNDEVDLTDQEMLALFNSRLQNSSYKINQRFSTPTFHSYGIDLSYEQSDQHEFLVKCDSCGHWQSPMFERKWINLPGLPDHIEDLTEIDDKIAQSLDIVNAFVMCERCENPLDLGREDNRQWVSKFPSRAHARGYRITPFSTNRLPPSYIVTQLLNYRRREAIRRFHNTVLGQAFTGADERLTVEQIKRVLKSPGQPNVTKSSQVWIGIDVGIACHIVLATGSSYSNLQIFHCAVVPYVRRLETVERFMSEFNIVGGCIDRLPYTPTADEMRDVTKGRIMPVQYTGTKEISVVKVPEKTHADHCQIDRTMALDRVFGSIKRQELTISGYTTYDYTLIEHLRDMVREEEPEKAAVWKKLSGSDHFFHAIAYVLIAPRVREIVDLAEDQDLRSNILFGSAEMAQHQMIQFNKPKKNASNGPLG